jgi:hypothetical protein
MRVNITIAAAIFAASLLSGCNTVSESDFKLGQIVLAESPTIRKEVLRDCIAQRRAESPAFQAQMAAFLKIPRSKFAQTVCRRLVNAYAKGRITYADITSSGAENGKLIRVMQGG